MSLCPFCGGIFSEGEHCDSPSIDTCERALIYAMNPIITTLDPPPVPSRQYDWEAIRRDYDKGDPIGRGPTREAAIEDLLEQESYSK